MLQRGSRGSTFLRDRILGRKTAAENHLDQKSNTSLAIDQSMKGGFNHVLMCHQKTNTVEVDGALHRLVF